MNDFEDLVDALMSAGSPDQVGQAYSSLLEELFRLPLWSSENRQGRRIPWREAKNAKKLMREAFDSPGLYIFGVAEIPLYIGCTEQSLWRRLSGRYVNGVRSQCQLAATHAEAIREQGIDGFPEEVREWYRRRFGGSTVRLEGAVAFARHGIDGIWFTLLPVSNEETIRPLEEQLIPIADKWNQEKGHPRLLNVQHNP
jgi:hypothetical protein